MLLLIEAMDYLNRSNLVVANNGSSSLSVNRWLDFFAFFLINFVRFFPNLLEHHVTS